MFSFTRKPKKKHTWKASRYRVTMLRSGIFWETEGSPFININLFAATKWDGPNATYYDMDGNPVIKTEEIEAGKYVEVDV